MSGVLAVFRRELGERLDSPVAWVAAVLFVLALHAAFFFLGFPVGDLRLPSFWAGRVASLDALFVWLPFLYALLAPALTMGAWADEVRGGTEELLFTLPLSTRAIVLGKFLAAWVFLVTLTLLALLPAAAVVARLGPLDPGTLLGGALGVVLFASACVALGLFFSCLAREPLVAFLGGSLFLLLLFGLGLFVRVLPAGWADVAWYASPSVHFFESAARGVFDVRDLVYFGSLTGAGLLLAGVLLEGRRWR